MPKISIILPCYNVSKYLDQCFECIFAQTFDDFEVIAVNDASTDDTLQRLRPFAEKDPRVIIVDKAENGGPSATRNAGMDAAKGEYIACIDPDDHIDSEYLAVLYDAAVKTGAELVRCLYYNESADGKKTPVMPDIAEQTLDRSEIERRYLKPLLGVSPERIVDAVRGCEAHIIMLVSVWGCLYKTSVIREHNLAFDTSCRNSEDMVFNIVYSLHTNKMHIVPKALYYYVVNEDSLWRSLHRDGVKFMHQRQLSWSAKKAVCDRYGLGEDYRDCYRGSVALASVQTSLIMTGKYGPGLSAQYCEIKSMLRLAIVRESVGRVPLKGLPLSLKIPLFCSKRNMPFLLWLLCRMANLLGKSPYGNY